MEFAVRAEKVSELEPLKKKVVACFKAAAEATGCKIDYEWDMQYANASPTPPPLGFRLRSTLLTTCPKGMPT
jgi:metal-dependent amidase/aminoacylase/carboxypeptidase family protein